MKTAVVANYCAGIKFLQFEFLVVELARRFRVRLDKYLAPQSNDSRRARRGEGYTHNVHGHMNTLAYPSIQRQGGVRWVSDEQIGVTPPGTHREVFGELHQR